MKRFCFEFPDKDGKPLRETKTEKEILDEFWERWSERMRSLGREHLISKENCVGDWVVNHWAWEVE